MASLGAANEAPYVASPARGCKAGGFVSMSYLNSIGRARKLFIPLPGEDIDMTHPRVTIDDPLDDDLDLSEDVLESLEDVPDDDYGDETQDDEERAAVDGLEQEDFIDPRGEDERGDD
jgi:hypothetical protein